MRQAFTLAEVLITLGIIGVVATITMPTLIQNHTKHSLETATKKFYSIMSQAVRQYMADEGVDDLRNTELSCINYPCNQHTVDTFVNKYFKVIKNCEAKADSCLNSQYKQFDGAIYETKYISCRNGRTYVLADGAVACIALNSERPMDIFVDINGKKGPNKVGYDFWAMSIFYDGSIDEGGITPECKKYNEECWSNGDIVDDQATVRKIKFEQQCKVWGYTGCFGHFLENGFKFDY